MGKNDLKVSRKETAGFRPGIKKEDLIKGLSEEDIERIRLWKELENTTIKNEDAMKCGIHSDQMYKQFLEKIGIIRETTRLAISAKNQTNKNKIEIQKGSTDRKFNETGAEMTIRDIEIENIKLNILIDKQLNDLRTFLYDIYRYVGLQRIDKQVFFNEEEYNKFMNETKEELKKDGIDLYKKAI